MVFILILSTVLLTKPAFAQESSSAPTLSDKVYADLALRGDLNNVSVSFYDGKSDSFGLSDTKHWLPASTVKLFVAMYAFKLIANHKINLSDDITVEDKNVVPTEFVTEELPSIQAGESMSIDRLLKQMITQSDNTAFNVLLDVLNRKAVTDYIHSVGITHSAVGSKLNLDTSQTQYEFDALGYGINTTTAEDYTKAFELIMQNKIPGAKNLLEILKQQKINYMIPFLLPKNVVVAHKHGDLDPLYHDGGIVFKENNKTYVISVFSNTGDPSLIAHISQLIYTGDSKLVGAVIPKNAPISETHPVDPLLSEKIPASNVLAAATLSQQPITAADLGITDKDLSLVKPSAQLPKITIPADSPFNFLTGLVQTFKRASAFSVKDKVAVDVQTMLIQVSQAKDLSSKGKVAQANAILKKVQNEIQKTSQSSSIENDAQAQISLQTVSETRFQILADSLKSSSSKNRDALIRVIGEQAKTTLNQVQPKIPLATNATNATQKPLVGEVVDKNDNAVVVRTAGGQNITIPTTNQDITVKTKEANTQVTETGAIISPTPTITSTKASLEKVSVGTTVAVVGSSVGNTFTPTFVLTNVPQELVAPQPVTVEKIDTKTNTIVVIENGVYTQVNVNKNTIIKGADTNIPLNQIKSGDVVVVHGEPLTPAVSPTPTPIQTSPTPSSNGKPNGKVSPTSSPGAATTNTTGAPVSPTSAGSVTKPSTTISQSPNKTSLTISRYRSNPSPAAGTTSKTSKLNNLPQTTQSQPKIIQSTSIKVIEKKEDVGKPVSPPTQAQPNNNSPKPQSSGQSSPQQKTQQSAPTSNSQPSTGSNASNKEEKKK